MPDPREQTRPIALVVTVLMLIGGSAIFYGLARDAGETGFILVILILFAMAPLVMTVSDLISKRRLPGGILGTYGGYLLLSLSRLAGVVMSIPLIVFDLLAGPAAVLIILIGLVGLPIYVFEELVGWDIKGWSWFGTDFHALVLLLMVLGAIGVVWARFFWLAGHSFNDRVTGLLADGLRPVTDLGSRLVSGKKWTRS